MKESSPFLNYVQGTRPLVMFENDVPEQIIAHDLDDVLDVYKAVIGVPYEGENDFEPLDPAVERKFWIDPSGNLAPHEEPGAVLTPMTVAEAIEHFGHGFYASSES